MGSAVREVLPAYPYPVTLFWFRWTWAVMDARAELRLLPDDLATYLATRKASRVQVDVRRSVLEQAAKGIA